MRRFRSATWIVCKKAPDGAAVAFCKTLTFEKPVKKATLYATAAGVYEVYINGEKLGDRVLKPGLTSYTTRLQYQRFSVGNYLKKKTEFTIEVGPGWGVGTFIFQKTKNFTQHVATIAELIVEYEDGEKRTFVTDETWKAYSTEVVYSDIYHGETVDRTQPAVCYGKAVKADINTQFIAQIGQGVVENERIAPVAKFLTPKGEKVLDFGQNLTGYVEICTAGNYGERISFSCAEVLDKEGNFYTENYRTARCKTTYVFDGKERVYKPKFSFQGFRYIRFDECSDEFWENLPPITAIVVHSKLKRTGYFTCGNEKIDQLYHNIIWGQKGNYLDIPTDCPQRDERLGWTGDAQIFCRTAAYNFDVYAFFRKWLGDLRIEQGPKGSIGGSCPIFEIADRTSAGFGDAVVIVPWEVYRAYGNKQILEENFTLMQRWIEYIRQAGHNEYLWLGDWHFGDWLAMDKGMEDSYVGATSNDLVASAFYAYSTQLFVKAGKALGKDMQEYEKLLDNIKREFRAYFLPNGKLLDEYPRTEQARLSPGEVGMDSVRKGKTQTALTLILHFGLCEDSQRTELAKQLDELIEESGGKMTTGFLGTPYLLHALTEVGNVKRAYDLFFREDTPSWLYAVNHGATTIWEHWNGIKEDGSFWSKDMNSFNHYAYGSVGDWIYGVVAGIDVADGGEGYKKARLAPHPDERLGFVKCRLNTVQGEIVSEWRYETEGVRFYFETPKGTETEICLPNGKTEQVGGGKHEYFIKKI
ncbi:MAG: family 78 glycoside hydrolase catalytic domain [Clostridia bacterium]|nr:family 78 glycoside hydrolase catalytic domain [Clostridia bacterium]